MSEDLTTRLPQSDSEKLTLVLSTVQALAVRVDNFEQTVKLRLYDARPVLEKVVTDIAKLQEGQRRLEEGHVRLEDRLGRLEEGQEGLRSELKDFRRHVDHRFLVLSGTVLARYMKLEQRVTLLELNTSPPNSQT